MPRPKSKFGFTLLETVLYLALLGVLMSSFLLFALTVGGVDESSSRRALAESEWRLWWQTLEREIGAAAEVLPPPGTSASDLELVLFSGETARVWLEGDQAWLERGSLRAPLLGKNIKVTNLLFSNRGHSGQASLEIVVGWQDVLRPASATTTTFVLGTRS